MILMLNVMGLSLGRFLARLRHCNQLICYKILFSIFNMDDIFYRHLKLFLIIFNIEIDHSLLAFHKAKILTIPFLLL